MGKNAVLLAMLIGISSLPTGGVQKIQAVRGYSGQSINLTIPSDPHHQIKAVTWTFTSPSGMLKLWDTENSDSNSQDNHTEAWDIGKVLGINTLRPEDQGVYQAQVTLHNDEIIFYQFNLTIYEPIPAPSISCDSNETLHCSVPSNASGLTYSWRFRHRDGDYQPYNVTGHIIQLPPRMFQGAEFQCIVSNSVDQKNVSMRLLNCHHYENRHHYFMLFSVFLLVIFLAVLIAVIYNGCKKKIKKSVQETDNIVALQDTSIHGKPASYATYKAVAKNSPVSAEIADDKIEQNEATQLQAYKIEQNEATQLQACVIQRPKEIKLHTFVEIHPPKQKLVCQPIEVPTSAQHQHHEGRKEKTYGDS